MKSKTVILLTLAAALWLWVAPARAGGWAVVTLEDWPENVVTGEPFPIVFSIRQHGQMLAPGYEPVIRGHHPDSGTRFEITALETKRTGFYHADLALPEPGRWTWSISYSGGADWAQPMPELAVLASGETARTAPGNILEAPLASSAGYLVAALGALALFAGIGFFTVTRSRGAAAAALAGVVVIAAGLMLVPRVQAASDPAPAPEQDPAAETVSLYDQGRFLFQAKGCIVCHNHAELRVGYTGIVTNIGPDFTWGTKRPVVFLRSWLADPQYFKPDTAMPNLELSEGEIESLAAFLMGELGD
jgi:hypothetical protein